MSARCKNCGCKLDSPHLLECPNCGMNPHSEHDKWTKAETRKLAWAFVRNHLWPIVVALSVLAGLVGFTCNEIYQVIYQGVLSNAKNHLTQLVNKQFEKKEARQMFEEVAKSEARRLILEEINPEVERFRTEIDSYVSEAREAKGRIESMEKELARLLDRTTSPVLSVIDTASEKTKGGIVRPIYFDIDKNVPLGEIEFHVRLPADSAARITKFAPRAYGQILASRLSDGGTSGLLRFTTPSGSPPSLTVEVSTPTVVILRGNYMSKPEMLDVK